MKELSIEQKAKAYDEVIKKMKGYVVDEFGCTRIKVANVFPELKESEDERIREALISHFCGIRDNCSKDWYGFNINDVITWLKKQGKTSPILSNSLNIGKVEQKPKFRVGDIIKCKYDDRQFTIKSVDLDKGIYTYTQDGCGNDIDYADEEFELVEQKPANKVEPKFKVGDWISGYYTNYKVLSVNNDGYVVEDVDGNKINILFENEKFHQLWTIQDAKDGDVLCCESGWTCLFKALDNHTNTFSSYCFMDSDKWFCDTGSEGHTLNKEFMKAYNGKIKPATKEQRDTFFTKMKEAGYEWNTEHKQLKKIEQNPAWSKEDETALDDALWCCKQAASIVKDENDMGNIWYAENWLESIKERVQPKVELTQLDKNILEAAIAFLNNLKHYKQ